LDIACFRLVRRLRPGPREAETLRLAWSSFSLALLIGCASPESVSESSAASSFGATSGETPAKQEPAPPTGPSADPNGAASRAPLCAPRATPSGFFAGETLDVDGTTRTYDLFVPEAVSTESLPIVFVFHGDGGLSLRPFLGLEQAAAGRAVVVYPHGFGGFDLSAPDRNQDFTFVERLRDALLKRLCADPGRIYAFGYSNGAFFSNMVACYRGPSLFRAIAVDAGGLYPPEGAGGHYDEDGTFVCPESPVAALVIHGTSDTVVSYADNGIGARNTWARANECGSQPRSTGFASCVTYDGCKKPVVFCPFDGGHALWGSAGPEAWKFFASL
jgi:polyhydroxybutyrate depolymerase